MTYRLLLKLDILSIFFVNNAFVFAWFICADFLYYFTLCWEVCVGNSDNDQGAPKKLVGRRHPIPLPLLPPLSPLSRLLFSPLLLFSPTLHGGLVRFTGWDESQPTLFYLDSTHPLAGPFHPLLVLSFLLPLPPPPGFTWLIFSHPLYTLACPFVRSHWLRSDGKFVPHIILPGDFIVKENQHKMDHIS